MGIRKFSASIPGRILIFVAIIGMHQSAGWVAALLTTLLGLLLISNGAIEGFVANKKDSMISESFSTDIDIIEKKAGTKWFDEEILGRESLVKTNLVNTLPVQG